MSSNQVSLQCHYLLQSGLLPHSWQTLAVVRPMNPRHWFLMGWLVSTVFCFLNVVSVELHKYSFVTFRWHIGGILVWQQLGERL